MLTGLEIRYIPFGMKNSNQSTARRRNPHDTREKLLWAGFTEVYQRGYQGADLNAILARAGVTKGALYHHFANKEALGHAIISDVIGRITQDKWLAPLDDCDHPIDALIAIVEATSLAPQDVSGGCPLNNLAQEMSPVDEGFRRRLSDLFHAWIASVEDALRLGQINGQVRRDIDAREAASFLIATYEGYISLAKNAQSPAMLTLGVRQVVAYLETLRAS